MPPAHSLTPKLSSNHATIANASPAGFCMIYAGQPAASCPGQGSNLTPFLQHIEERSAAKETKTYIPQIMW